MRTIYPKRYSRAQRKRLRARPYFSFGKITLDNVRSLWNSISDSPNGWIVLGGNLIPMDNN